MEVSHARAQLGKILEVMRKDQGKTSGKAGCGEEVCEAGGEPREAGQARRLLLPGRGRGVLSGPQTRGPNRGSTGSS